MNNLELKKFRIWNTNSKCFTRNNENNISGLNIFEIHEYLQLHEISNVNHLIFPQYIGSLDVNGREIYEGDIVRYITPEDGPSQFLYKICFGKYTNYFFDYDLGFYGIDTHDTITRLGNSNKEFEVVGNVYENSELMVFSAPYEPMIDNI